MAGERGSGQSMEQPKSRAEKKAETLAINQPKNVEKHKAEKAAKALVLEAKKNADATDSATQAEEIRVDLGIAEKPADVAVVKQEAPAQTVAEKPKTKAEKNREYNIRKKAGKAEGRAKLTAEAVKWQQLANENRNKPPEPKTEIVNLSSDLLEDDESEMQSPLPAAEQMTAEVIPEVPTETPQEAKAETGAGIHRAERRVSNDSFSSDSNSSSVPGMDAGELGRAMKSSRDREAAGENLTVQDVTVDKPSAWSKFKDFFKSSAEKQREDILAKPYEQVAIRPRSEAEEKLSQTGMNRPELSTYGDKNSQEATKASVPGMDAGELGRAMKASRDLEAAGKDLSVQDVTVENPSVWSQVKELFKSPEQKVAEKQLDEAWNDMAKELGSSGAVLEKLLDYGVPMNVLKKNPEPKLLSAFIKEPGLWATVNGDKDKTVKAVERLVKEMSEKRAPQAETKKPEEKKQAA